jgi:purine nucleosidase
MICEPLLTVRHMEWTAAVLRPAAATATRDGGAADLAAALTSIRNEARAAGFEPVGRAFVRVGASARAPATVGCFVRPESTVTASGHALTVEALEPTRAYVHARITVNAAQVGALQAALGEALAAARRDGDLGAAIAAPQAGGDEDLLCTVVAVDDALTAADCFIPLACPAAALPPIPVVLDHDGGVDDLIALLLLASATAAPLPGMARRVELIGTTILDADCFAKPTGELCRRLLCAFAEVSPAMARVPVGVSPIAAPAIKFPDAWRKDCLAMLDLPCLHTAKVDAALAATTPALAAAAGAAAGAHGVDEQGHELLARLVMDSPRPVAVVVTGPLSNVAYALRKYGERFARNVHDVYVMGGAVHVAGNVVGADLAPDHPPVDGSAEWNIAWDAVAAREVLESPLLRRKLLYSLDATNHVPVTSAFVRSFGKVVAPGTATPTQLASFCGAAWATTTFLEFLFGAARGYYAWDVLTSAGLLVPSIVSYVPTRITVDAQRGGPSEGRTAPVAAGADAAAGAVVHVASDIDAQRFYELVRRAAQLL